MDSITNTQVHFFKKIVTNENKSDFNLDKFLSNSDGYPIGSFVELVNLNDVTVYLVESIGETTKLYPITESFDIDFYKNTDKNISFNNLVSGYNIGGITKGSSFKDIAPNNKLTEIINKLLFTVTKSSNVKNPGIYNLSFLKNEYLYVTDDFKTIYVEKDSLMNPVDSTFKQDDYNIMKWIDMPDTGNNDSSSSDSADSEYSDMQYDFKDFNTIVSKGLLEADYKTTDNSGNTSITSISTYYTPQTGNIINDNDKTYLYIKDANTLKDAFKKDYEVTLSNGKSLVENDELPFINLNDSVFIDTAATPATASKICWQTNDSIKKYKLNYKVVFNENLHPYCYDENNKMIDSPSDLFEDFDGKESYICNDNDLTVIPIGASYVIKYVPTKYNKTYTSSEISNINNIYNNVINNDKNENYSVINYFFKTLKESYANDFPYIPFTSIDNMGSITDNDAKFDTFSIKKYIFPVSETGLSLTLNENEDDSQTFISFVINCDEKIPNIKITDSNNLDITDCFIYDKNAIKTINNKKYVLAISKLPLCINEDSKYSITLKSI